MANKFLQKITSSVVSQIKEEGEDLVDQAIAKIMEESDELVNKVIERIMDAKTGAEET